MGARGLNEVALASGCVVCGGRAFAHFRYGLLGCTECQLVVSPLVWTPGAAERVNREEFGGATPRVRSAWTDLQDRWNARRTLRRLERAGVRRGGRLLEVGPGSGALLRAAKEAGFEAMGCDLSATVCRSVSESLGIAMHHGAIHTVARTGGFRAVVANHVLEHTDDPVAFLSAARDLLDPCGVLHLAVPNIGAWEARLSGWTSYEPYHMLYFDKRSLVRTVERSGLRIRRVETREPFSGWFLAVLRTILGFNRGGDFSAPKSLWRRAVRRRPLVVEHTYRVAALAAGTALWPLRVLQGRLGYGEELICLATK